MVGWAGECGKCGHWEIFYHDDGATIAVDAAAAAANRLCSISVQNGANGL